VTVHAILNFALACQERTRQPPEFRLGLVAPTSRGVFARSDVAYKAKTKFLAADESFLTCERKIENGMHGHLGPAGKFGSPAELSKMVAKLTLRIRTAQASGTDFMSRARVASCVGITPKVRQLDPQPHRDVPERQAQYHHSLQRRVESVNGEKPTSRPQ